MRTKTLIALCLSIAIISAGVSAVIVNIQRTAQIRAKAESDAAIEDAAEAKRKEAAKIAEAEAEKRRAAEVEAKAKKDALAAANVEREKAEIERDAAVEKRKAAEAAAEEAKARNAEAREKKEAEALRAKTARDERDKAKAEAEKATALAQAEADRLATEKVRSEKTIAEAQILENRKIDFNQWQSDLMELKLELDERERALKPEKTITDLAWAGGMEDTIIDEDGNAKKQKKVKYDPEADKTIPRTSRNLARAERLARENLQFYASDTRTNIVASLEKIYTEALRDNRVLDADYVRKSILSLYPDWKFSASNTNTLTNAKENTK